MNGFDTRSLPGTVLRFDHQTCWGVVRTDSGDELPFAPTTFSARPGGRWPLSGERVTLIFSEPSNELIIVRANKTSVMS